MTRSLGACMRLAWSRPRTRTDMAGMYSTRTYNMTGAACDARQQLPHNCVMVKLRTQTMYIITAYNGNKDAVKL